MADIVRKIQDEEHGVVFEEDKATDGGMIRERAGVEEESYVGFLQESWDK